MSCYSFSFESNYKGERSAFHPTRFKNFQIENITCKQVNEVGFYLSGIKGFPIDNILLKNIKIENAATAYCLTYGNNIIFDAVVVNGVKMSKNQKKNVALVKLKTH